MNHPTLKKQRKADYRTRQGYMNGFVPQPPLTEPETYLKKLLQIGWSEKIDYFWQFSIICPSCIFSEYSVLQLEDNVAAIISES